LEKTTNFTPSSYLEPAVYRLKDTLKSEVKPIPTTQTGKVTLRSGSTLKQPTSSKEGENYFIFGRSKVAAVQSVSRKLRS
jgi:hypothetical protein